MKAYFYFRAPVDEKEAKAISMQIAEVIVSSGFKIVEGDICISPDNNNPEYILESFNMCMAGIVATESDALVLPSLTTIHPKEEFAKALLAMLVDAGLLVFVIKNNDLVAYKSSIDKELMYEEFTR